VDHEPRRARDRQILGCGLSHKSALQVLDEGVERVPLLLFDARGAAEDAGAFGVAFGLRDGNRPVVTVDPLVDQPTVLSEQTQKVVGLALIRGVSHKCDAINTRGGPTRAQRPGLMNMSRDGTDRGAVG